MRCSASFLPLLRLALLLAFALTLGVINGGELFATRAHANMVPDRMPPDRSPDPALLKSADLIIVGTITGVRLKDADPRAGITIKDIDGNERVVFCSVLTVAVRQTFKGKCDSVVDVEVLFDTPESFVFFRNYALNPCLMLDRQDKLLDRRLFILRKQDNGALRLADVRRAEMAVTARASTNPAETVEEFIAAEARATLMRDMMAKTPGDVVAALQTVVQYHLNDKATLEAIEVLTHTNPTYFEYASLTGILNQTREVELTALFTLKALGVESASARIVALICDRTKNQALGMRADAIRLIAEPYLKEAIRTKTNIGRFLNVPSHWIRLEAIQAMENTRSPVYIPIYGECLFSEHKDVILAGMEGLKALKVSPADLKIPKLESATETFPADILFQWQRWWQAEGDKVIAKHLPNYQRKLDMAE